MVDAININYYVWIDIRENLERMLYIDLFP